MQTDSLDRLLSQLEEAKNQFGADGGTRLRKLLGQLGRQKFDDADSLIRFHEALLFIRAYPPGAAVLRQAETLLASFAARVERLGAAGADLTPFDYIEYSGIAGTALSGTFSYGIARWLVNRYPRQVEVDWDRFEKKERLGAVLPRFLPLLYEDSLVEANVPYRDWLRAAKQGDGSDLAWLIDRFERLALSDRDRAALYDSLELPIQWRLEDTPASRTLNKRPVGKIFYHRKPLIRRGEVSLDEEMLKPLTLTKLSPENGQAILDRVRETTVVRYRELYGIPYGDPKSVVRANVGRGVEIFLWGLPPAMRLPLRAYHAGFTLKNGVPINYVEGITLFERMELGFNTFYTFRDGETAWVYAQALRCLRQLTGATRIALDPYQIGHHNDEAIESGAFWFYRKLGFRPTRPEIAKLMGSEERKIAADREYRTPARTLRRLSAGGAIYEAPGGRTGDWDRFQVRNLGLAVQRRMAEQFNADAAKIRAAATMEVAQALGAQPASWQGAARQAFEDWALVLTLIPDLSGWTRAEKRAVIGVIRAKGSRDEAEYIRLLQSHKRLRQAIIKLGSESSG